TYLEYCLADHDPPFWLARGPASRQVVAPLTRALKEAGVDIVRGVQINGVSCSDGRAQEVTLQRTRHNARSGTWAAAGRSWSEDVDELVLAVPAPALSKIVRTGRAGGQIVEFDP